MSLPNDPIRPGAGLGEPSTYGTTGTSEAGKTDVAKQQAGEVTAEARQRAGEVADSAKAGVGEVADTAKEGASYVAGIARDEARSIADQAGLHAQSLFGEAKAQFVSQAGTQQGQIASTLSSLGKGLESIQFGDERTDQLAGDLARQASARLSGLGTWLEQREPGDVLDEVRRFARRRPGTFLAAAALTGLVAGRLTRGIADDARQDDEDVRYSRYADTRYGYARPTGYGYDADQAARYGSPTGYGAPTMPGYMPADEVQPAHGTAGYAQPAYRGDAETMITSTERVERPENERR